MCTELLRWPYVCLLDEPMKLCRRSVKFLSSKLPHPPPLTSKSIAVVAFNSLNYLLFSTSENVCGVSVSSYKRS